MIGVLSPVAPRRAVALPSSPRAAIVSSVVASPVAPSLAARLVPRATGVDLRAPEPAPARVVVQPVRSSEVTIVRAAPVVPVVASAVRVPSARADVILSPGGSSSVAAPSVPLAPASPVRVSPADVAAASELVPPSLPFAPPPSSGASSPALEREAGPAVTPAAAVGVRVEAPDWAWIAGGVAVLGGVGWFLWKRRGA